MVDYLTIDGSAGQNRFNANALFFDNKYLLMGDGADLQIAHTGTDSIIDNFTGDLLIRQQVNDKDVIIQSDNGSGGQAYYFQADGSSGEAKMFHYGNVKLATSSGGINVTGAITSSGTITSTGNGVTNVMSFSDRGIFGTTSNHPVEIRANGTEAIRIDTSQRVGIGTSAPIQKLQVVGSIYTNTGHFYADSGKRILWGNSQQWIEGTNSYGLEFGAGNTVRAFLTQDGKLGVNTTTVTYPLTVNLVNSSGTGTLGLVPDTDNGHYIRYGGTGTNANTFRLLGTGDTERFSINNSGHARINSGRLYLGSQTYDWIERSGNFFKNQTQYGYIQLGPNNAGFAHIDTDRSQFYFNRRILVDEGIVSSYNEDLVLQRASDPAHQLTIGTSEIASSIDISLPDVKKIKLGSSDDLLIYHDSLSVIEDAGANGLEIRTDGPDIRMIGGANELMTKFVKDGAVELYHNNSKKFETTSTGVFVSGLLQTNAGVSIALGAPNLTLQDTTDDDDHQIYFKDNGGTVRYQITSAGDQFNFATNGSREIVFLPGDTEKFRIGTAYNESKQKIRMVGSSVDFRVRDTNVTDANHDTFVVYATGQNKFSLGVTSISGFSDDITIDGANNRVGIGTASPATTLEVAGDLTLPSNGQIKFRGTNHYPRIYASSNDLLINVDNGSGTNFTALRIDNVAGDITTSANVLVGTTNPTSVGTVNRNLIVGSTTNADEVGVTLNVMEGSNNRRVKFFLDDNDGVYGFDATASSGVPAFVIRSGTAEKIRLVDGKVGIGTDAPDFLLDVVGDIGMSGKLYHNGDHNTYIGFTGDTQTFRTGGADRVTINNNGVGIDTTNPSSAYSLHVNGSAYFADPVYAQGFSGFSQGNANIPANTAGYYKIAEVVRGTGTIQLSFTGGNFSPTTYVIHYFKNWSTSTELKLNKYGVADHITKARIRKDSDDNDKYFVEVYFASNSNAPTFQVYHNQLDGYYNGSNQVFTGSLTAGSTNGVTYAESDFVDNGMTMDRLLVTQINNNAQTLVIGGTAGTTNVGIGDNSPLYALEVNEASNYAGVHIRGSNAPNVTFGRGTNSTQEWKVGISGNSGTSFAISKGTAADDKLVIDSNGLVGIGQTTPTAPLEVIGLNGIKLKQGAGYGNYVQFAVAEANLTIKTESVNTAQHNPDIIFSPDLSETMRLTTSSMQVTGNNGIDVHTNDTGIVLRSGNSSATGIPDQFMIRHSSGNVNISNNRGVINLNNVGDITKSSGDLLVDVAGDIRLDADGGDIKFADGGTVISLLSMANSDTTISTNVVNKDIIFKGFQGGGTSVTALTLDMSASGKAIFGGAVEGGSTIKAQDHSAWNVDANLTTFFEDDAIQLTKTGSNYLVAEYGNKTYSDQVIEVEFRSTNSTHFGIFFFGQASAPKDNSYNVILRNGTNGVRLQTRISGTQAYPTGLGGTNGTATGIDVDDGNWHSLKATISGTRLVVDVDGVTILDGTMPTTYTSGTVGLMLYDNTAYFRNFQVRETTAAYVIHNNFPLSTYYGSGDVYLDLHNSYGNASGTLLTADNGNTWLNADGGKDLWLNWYSKNNPSSYADLAVGNGNGGNSILFVDGSSSRVGIGTSTPANKLDVVGTIYSQGGLRIGSSSSGEGIIRYNPGAGSGIGITTQLFSTAGIKLFVAHTAAGGGVGIGTTTPAEKLQVEGNIRASGSYKIGANKFVEQVGTRLNIGDVDNSDYIVDITAYGDTSSIVLNDGFIDVVGDFDIAGALSKNSGSFKIDHPLKPDTHHLVHSFVEGPQADNLYRGKIELVDGRAVIDLDEWFGMTPGTFLALNRDLQAFVSNEEDWDAVRAKVMGSQLVIECQNARSKASVSWLVVGERQDNEIYESSLTDDYGKIIVEPVKQVVE